VIRRIVVALKVDSLPDFVYVPCHVMLVVTLDIVFIAGDQLSGKI
jgi:hypothetical protein